MGSRAGSAAGADGAAGAVDRLVGLPRLLAAGGLGADAVGGQSAAVCCPAAGRLLHGRPRHDLTEPGPARHPAATQPVLDQGWGETPGPENMTQVMFEAGH